MSVLWEIQVDPDLEVYQEIIAIEYLPFRPAREDMTVKLKILALLEGLH